MEIRWQERCSVERPEGGRFRIVVFGPIIVRRRECNPLCAVGEDGRVELAGGRQGVLTQLSPPSQAFPTIG